MIILTILKYILIGILVLFVIGVGLTVLLFAWIFINCVIHDEVEEIDNSDGSIICGITNKPCIKSTLHTYWNDCEGCPTKEIEDSHKGE